MIRLLSLLSASLLLAACGKIKLVPVECFPHEEVCNGVDDNCDGNIDEDTSISCSTACGSGVMTCEKGKLSECSARQPASTDACDGVDSDCDGQIDEDAEIAPCYPPGTYGDLTNGECRFGVNRCAIGVYQCIGWQGPTTEKCDGLDQNCNGEIDEGVSVSLDVVFVLDHSVSMADIIDQLLADTANWARKNYKRVNLNVALVSAPSPNPSRDGAVTLEKNFTNAGDFVTTLQTQGGTNGGLEATIDAIYYISSPSNPLGLRWTLGSKRIIILYSDEEPQSWDAPPITELQAQNEALLTDTSVYIFTSNFGRLFWGAWNNQLFLKGAAMENALNAITVSNACK